MELKNKLLETGYFIDNKQLDAYIDIISASVVDKLDYTEKHHIIPRTYFKLTKQKIDNSTGNIVKLSYFNHLLAHYYLSFCTIGRLKQASICAFIMLVETGLEILSKPELSAIKQLKDYSTLKIASIRIKQEQCKKIGSLKKTAEHKKALSAARDLHSTTKNKHAIYNKNINKVKFVYENELDQFLAAGWVLGGKPLSQEAKNKISKGNSVALKGKKHQKIAAGHH